MGFNSGFKVLSGFKDTSVTIREKIRKERPNITAVSSVSGK